MSCEEYGGCEGVGAWLVRMAARSRNGQTCVARGVGFDMSLTGAVHGCVGESSTGHQRIRAAQQLAAALSSPAADRVG